jgi:sec-independent protein translocase protein TatB
MFGLGFSEILLILVVALLVFGPKRLPEIAQSLGRALGEFRRTLDDVKREMVLPPLDMKNELPTGLSTSQPTPSDMEKAHTGQPEQQEEGQPVKSSS